MSASQGQRFCRMVDLSGKQMAAVKKPTERDVDPIVISYVVEPAFPTESLGATSWHWDPLQVSEWVIKFNVLSWTADSEVHIVHISCVIIAYTLE